MSQRGKDKKPRKKRGPASFEDRQKMSKARKGRTYEEIYGERAVDEKRKRSESQKGRVR